MKTSKTGLLVLVALLGIFSAMPLFAGNYANGFVNSAGYTWRDGYWWLNGQAFTVKTVPNCYTSGGRQYCNTPTTTYVAVPTAQAPAATTITQQDISNGNWRTKALELAKQQDAAANAQKAQEAEQAAFAETMRMLKLNNQSVATDGYATGLYQPGYVAQGYSQYPATQGTTLYGYREVADVYGNADLGQMFNSVMRLREQANNGETKLTSEAHSLASEWGAAASRIKEIEAKGIAAAAALSATSPPQTLMVKPLCTDKPAPATLGLSGTNIAKLTLDAIVHTKCASCHSAEKKNGELDLTRLSELTGDQRKKMLARIIHPDPQQRMPLGKDHQPGAALSADEVAVFYSTLYNAPTATTAAATSVEAPAAVKEAPPVPEPSATVPPVPAPPAAPK